jgi:hypothetical protein
MPSRCCRGRPGAVTLTAFSPLIPKTSTNLNKPCTCPTPADPIICDKGFAGTGSGATAAALGYPLIRPIRHDPRPFPTWPRQRIEATTHHYDD